MRCFKYLVFIFNILILITGCSKNQTGLIDDRVYCRRMVQLIKAFLALKL